MNRHLVLITITVAISEDYFALRGIKIILHQQCGLLYSLRYKTNFVCNSSEEEGDAGEEKEPATVFGDIRPEEIPDVPANRFLSRDRLDRDE